MNKKLKYLSKNIKDCFNVDEINEIARDTKFIQRKGNITAQDFLVFSKQLSRQSLDKRFNKNSVEFMKKIFIRFLYVQNNTLTSLERTLRTYFDRVIIMILQALFYLKSLKRSFWVQVEPVLHHQ